MNSQAVDIWVARSDAARFVRKLVLAAALLCPAVVARAQEGEGDATGPPPAAPVEAPEQLASPHATVTTFYEAMQKSDFETAATCLQMPRGTGEFANVVAPKLYQIIRAVEAGSLTQFPILNLGKPDMLLFADVPADAVVDDQTTYILFPRTFVHNWTRIYQPEGSIELVRTDDGRWLFSEATCVGAHALFDSLSDIIFPEADARPETVAQWFESILPDSLSDPRNKLIGLKYWQWIGLLALILVGVTFDYITRSILARASRVMIRRRGGEARPETIKRAVRPFGLFVAAIFWVFAIRILDLPLTALQFLLPAVKLFAMAAGVWAAYRLTDLLAEVFASKASQTTTKIDDVLVPLVRKTVKIFITAIGIIFIADSLDIEILPLLTGLGIGSLAFAFAAKDTIENFFGSVAVITDRPFEVGDWVEIGDVEGTVEELGFRSTRVRTFYNSLVTVPNATLVRATVDNYGRRKYRRWKTYINITYDTSPDKIEMFCEGIRELIRLHPYTRKDYFQVWLHQFSAHSLDILVYAFHETPDWQTELRERQRLMLDIMRLADQLGVEFAFPTQTLHIHQEEKQQSPEPETDQPSHGDPTGQWQRKGMLAARKLTESFAWRREKPESYKIAFSGRDGTDVADDEETQVESKTGGDA